MGGESMSNVCVLSFSDGGKWNLTTLPRCLSVVRPSLPTMIMVPFYQPLNMDDTA